MGFFSWLFRRKKENEYMDENQEMPEETEQNINPKLDIGAGPRDYYPGQQQSSDDREFQILSGKLDIINSKLDLINQRLNNLEQRGREERPTVQRW